MKILLTSTSFMDTPASSRFVGIYWSRNRYNAWATQGRGIAAHYRRL